MRPSGSQSTMLPSGISPPPTGVLAAESRLREEVVGGPAMSVPVSINSRLVEKKSSSWAPTNRRAPASPWISKNVSAARPPASNASRGSSSADSGFG